MTISPNAAEDLAVALRRSVDGEVDFGSGRRAQYSSDASNYRFAPLGVVFPRHADDLAAVLAMCREAGVPVTPRGGGTSIGGQAIGPGVVLDCSRHLTRVLEVDPERRIARVEPGVVLDDLQQAAAPHGLLFGPDPSTHSRCTVGGMVGNNACGSHSVAWGRTADNVEALDVLFDDGTRTTVAATPPSELDRIVAAGGRAADLHTELRDLVAGGLATIRTRFGRFRRQVSGYALEHLLPENGFHVARALVGSEGTCALLAGTTVGLVSAPAARGLLVAGYPDPVAAAEAVPAILGRRPLTIEGVDEVLLDAVRRIRPDAPAALPDGRAWLYVEVSGETAAEASAQARTLGRELSRAGATGTLVVADRTRQRALWRIREEGAGLGTRLPDGGEAWPGWEDAAVPPERLASYLRGLRALMARHGRRGVVYGHYGEGCLHARIDFDLHARGGPMRYRAFVEEAADLVVAHGGSLSGEHGDGRARSELLPRQYGADGVALLTRFKAAWDPSGLFNPGVIVRPDPLDAHLRPAAPTRRLPVALDYPHDGGDLGKAVRRCVGVGQCRTAHGGVMCPSFRATRDERDSTRGRARVLHEMLVGEVVRDGWRSAEVREALDLCLACKGCASDCPVGVDMATYKAEFLHHHYRRRVRPLTHYSLGFLPLWARLASVAPGVVNAAMAGPRVGRLLRRAGGIAPRELPRFAGESLHGWWRRGGSRGGTGDQVLVWPDTFTNRFLPEVGRAAIAVLQDAGLSITLPSRPVCCGLTLTTTGQVGLARWVLRRSLRAVEPFLRAGTPVVGLEPSCLAHLRHDAPALLPGDPRVRALAEATHTFAEALDRLAPGWEPPSFRGRVVVQTHCHQHAVLGTDADDRLLSRLGADAHRLDTGCCGLAGDFGFSARHFDVSLAVAEHALLPALRGEDDATVLADGFSCRTQIRQLAHRPAVHVAELVARAAQ